MWDSYTKYNADSASEKPSVRDSVTSVSTVEGDLELISPSCGSSLSDQEKHRDTQKGQELTFGFCSPVLLSDEYPTNSILHGDEIYHGGNVDDRAFFSSKIPDSSTPLDSSNPLDRSTPPDSSTPPPPDSSNTPDELQFEIDIEPTNAQLNDSSSSNSVDESTTASSQDHQKSPLPSGNSAQSTLQQPASLDDTSTKMDDLSIQEPPNKTRQFLSCTHDSFFRKQQSPKMVSLNLDNASHRLYVLMKIKHPIHTLITNKIKLPRYRPILNAINQEIHQCEEDLITLEHKHSYLESELNGLNHRRYRSLKHYDNKLASIQGELHRTLFRIDRLNPHATEEIIEFTSNINNPLSILLDGQLKTQKNLKFYHVIGHANDIISLASNAPDLAKMIQTLKQSSNQRALNHMHILTLQPDSLEDLIDMGNALNNPIIRNALEHHHLLTHFSHFTVTHHYPWMATSMCDQNFEATKTMLMSLKNVMEHTARHLTFHIHPSHPFNRTYTLDRFRNCLGRRTPSPTPRTISIQPDNIKIDPWTYPHPDQSSRSCTMASGVR